MPDEVIDALAAYRLTRLVVQDDLPIAVKLRNAARESGPAWVGDLLDCPWCAGFWVSVAVVAARRAAPRAWSPVAGAFAFSAVTGAAATLVNLAQKHLEE